MWSESFTGEKPESGLIGRCVRVVWLDPTCFSGEWLGPAEMGEKELSRCELVGFIARETEDALFIAQARADCGEYINPFGVPRGCILSIVDIETGTLY